VVSTGKNKRVVNPWKTEEGKETLRNCYRSTAVHAKTFFPERFRLPFSPLIHNKICDALDDPSITRLVLAAPRGTGKTSLMTAFQSKMIMFQMCHYIIALGSSQETIMEQTENLKRELRENERIIGMFGEIDSKDDFAKQRWIARNKQSGIDTMVMPRGATQTIRGRLYKNWRPDLIICDDIDSEDISDEQRRKIKYWFYNTVCNLIELGDKKARIIVVGSITDDGSLVSELLRDEEWYGIKSAIGRNDEKGNLISNWPERISDEALRQRKEYEKKRGNLDGFYREMMSEPISSEDAIFMQDYFQDYKETEARLGQKGSVQNVILLDPARTSKQHSADSAIVGVGVDLDSGDIYVRDITAGQFYPDVMYGHTLDMAERLGTLHIGIETCGLHDFITQPFLQFCAQRGRRINLIELPPRGDKDRRISALASFYRQRRVYHNASVCGMLEEQLLRHPASEKKDVADAFAYIVPMMEKGQLLCTKYDDSDVGLTEFYAKQAEEDKKMGAWGDEWQTCPNEALVAW